MARFSFALLTVFLIFFPFRVQTLSLDSRLFLFSALQEDICLGPFGELLIDFKIVADGLEGFIHRLLEKIYGKMMD